MFLYNKILFFNSQICFIFMVPIFTVITINTYKYMQICNHIINISVSLHLILYENN